MRKPTTYNLQPTTRILLGLLLVVGCWSLVPSALAQEIKPTEYTMLAPIPQLATKGEKTNAVAYITGLFKLVIGLAGVLAVVMIIYAGIKYMSTDAFSGKEEAKGVIENALWGLGLAIAAWLILYTINPKLVEIKFDIEPQKIATSTLGGGGGGELQQRTVNAVAGLREACSNCAIRITSTTGDSHDPESLHYRGLAVDIGADANLTKFLTGQTTNPKACSTYLKTLNGVDSRFLWEPLGSTCGGAVPSSGDHWHMGVTQ